MSTMQFYSELQALYAAHRWLAIPTVLFVVILLLCIVALVDGFIGYRQARVVHAIAPVIPMGPSHVRPFSLPAAKGWEKDRPKLNAIVGGRRS